jgi:hypothetical protein
MARLKNLKCSIEVDGVDLPEYPDNNNVEHFKDLTEAERLAHKSFVYIQVAEYRQFKIFFEANSEDNELAKDINCIGLEIILDGQSFRKR